VDGVMGGVDGRVPAWDIEAGSAHEEISLRCVPPRQNARENQEGGTSVGMRIAGRGESWNDGPSLVRNGTGRTSGRRAAKCNVIANPILLTAIEPTMYPAASNGEEEQPVTSVTGLPRIKALKAAPLDSWVLLSSDESTILAAGDSYEEVSAKADALNSSEDFVIIKTPKSWDSLSV
jgi:hypothetical protein